MLALEDVSLVLRSGTIQVCNTHVHTFNDILRSSK
jgi:hypothetical protein